MQEQLKTIREKINAQKSNKTQPQSSEDVAGSTDIVAKFRVIKCFVHFVSNKLFPKK